MGLYVPGANPLRLDGVQAPNQYVPLAGNGLLSQGLVFAQIYTGLNATVGGKGVFGLLDNRPATVGGSTVWNAGQPDCTSVSGSPFSYSSSHPPTVDLALGAFSIFARVRPRAGWGSTSGIAERNDGNTVNAGWQVLCHSGGTALWFVRASIDFTAGTNTALATEKYQTVGIAYPGDLTASNTKIYYDGVLQTLNTTTNGSGAQGSDATNQFSVGEANFTANAGTFEGFLDCLYVWKRYLRQEEFILLSTYPYLPVTVLGMQGNRSQFSQPAAATSANALFYAI